MSDKRRDNKGRILHEGERQRSDGMYEFRYTCADGTKKSVYSWKLVATDKVPSGKRCKEALRDLIKIIEKDLDDGISPTFASKTSLNDFFERYMTTKTMLKPSTRVNYLYMYNSYIRGEIGYKKLSEIKYSDIKRFYQSLIDEKGFKPRSMEIIHTILHPVFETAVRDDYIRKNPTKDAMSEIKSRNDWQKTRRHALTIPQQTAFLNFCKNNLEYNHWYPVFVFLLGTGCRIGEATGLRWEDCDFENNLISINHSLMYRPSEKDGIARLQISTPKTKAGIRTIPMLSDVKRVLLEEKRKQEIFHCNSSIVDGYTGFVFTNRFGEVQTGRNINRAIYRICDAYNAREDSVAKIENREPIFLPHFSAHSLRHTFCTRFCENETNLKVIQEIMGHADITTTMDIYNEATLEKKKESFSNLEGKISIF